MKETRAVRQWADGERKPSAEVMTRLRHAYHVAALLAARDSQAVGPGLVRPVSGFSNADKWWRVSRWVEHLITLHPFLADAVDELRPSASNLPILGEAGRKAWDRRWRPGLPEGGCSFIQSVSGPTQ